MNERTDASPSGPSGSDPHRVLPAVLLAAALAGLLPACATIDEIVPAPGYDCDVGTDPPPGGGGAVPGFSVRYDFGGSEDPTDDSRTVWIRADSNLTLRSTDGNETEHPLTAGTVYALEVLAFTAGGGTGNGGGTGGFPTTRDAELTEASGQPLDLDLELETGTGWGITDFTVSILPSPEAGYFRVFLLDLDATQQGFCVTFDVGSSGAPTSGALLGLRLDPVGSSPRAPRAHARYSLDELGAAAPSPLSSSTRQFEPIEYRVPGNTVAGTLGTNRLGRLNVDHAASGPTVTLDEFTLTNPTQVVATQQLGGITGTQVNASLPGAFVYLENDPGTNDKSRLVLSTPDAAGNAPQRFVVEVSTADT